MASGLQASSRPSSSTWTQAFAASTGVVINVSACNRAGSDTTLSIATVPSGGTRGPEHEIESGTTVATKSVIERTGIVLDTGDALWVESADGDVAFNIWGVELS